MGGRSAAGIAAALWLGVLAGRAGGTAAAVACTLLAVLAAASAPRAPRLLAAALLVVAGFLAGAVRGAVTHAAFERARLAVRGGSLYRLEGVVEGPSALGGDRPSIVFSVVCARPPLAAGTRVRLRLPEGSDADWGDRLECLAEIAPPSPVRNPGGWDGLAGAEASGVAASGRAITAVHAGRTWTGVVLAATVVPWRRAIERKLAARLTAEAGELVIPLVTGDRGALPPELDADFRAAGLVHLLALSGLHLSALAAAVRVLAATAGGGVGARAAAGVLAAVFYAGLAGPIPSLLRSAVGEVWLGVARAARRPADPVQALAITVIVLLGAAPGRALDLGFQLSCAATLGLATFAPFTREVRGPARAAVVTIGATLAAQWMCAPILMARVHGLSWPALLANLVAVPTCGLLLAAAWIAVLVDAVAPGAGHSFFSACELLARALVAETTFAARWPLALLPTGDSAALAVLAAVGAGSIAAAACGPADLLSRRHRWPPGREALLLFGAIVSALAVTFALVTPARRPPPGRTWVVVLDVGQGDAIAIGMADGWWLVDAGPRSPGYDSGDRVVRPFLRHSAIRNLDGFALTHDDGDHTGGAHAVLTGVAVARLAGPPALPGVPGPLARFDRWRPRPAARGDTLHRDPAIVVRWPPLAGAPAATRGDNSAGLVLELAVDSTRALLTADVDSVVEASLAPATPVALLKVGHHGSASSSGAAFLARVRPRVAAISVGERNVYGHPAPAALARLAAAGARLDRTDREGALWYEIGPHGLRRVDWRRGGEAREGAAVAPARATPAAAPRRD